MALASLFMTAGSAWATIPDGACGTTVFDLNNEKNSADKLGTVTVANDATNLYVKFDLTVTDSNFNYVNLWVGTDLQTKAPVPYMFGNPIKFNAPTYTYVLPLSSLGIIDVTTSCPVIAIDAFAVVSDGEVTTNGRAQGKYTLCCDQPPELGECETAFAKGGYVFTTDSKSNPENLPSLKLTKNRWGWAINVKDNGTTVYNIWKGAGLNDTTKGELVGTLTVEKNGTLVKVTYNLTGDVMNELHIYVGDKMPNTIAPGQFGFTKDFDPAVSSFSKTFSVTDTNSDGIWIIAHAVSCTVLD